MTSLNAVAPASLQMVEVVLVDSMDSGPWMEVQQGKELVIRRFHRGDAKQFLSTDHCKGLYDQSQIMEWAT